MAESTKDLVAKRDMQLRMFNNMPNAKDKARQDKLDKDSSPEEARKAGKKKFFEMYEDDGRTPKNKEKEMKDMKKMNMGGMAKGYKEGGKVRGAGIAKKGVRACKMR